ncbi:MAG: SLC13 family permease [Candidatus Aminicenantia bacterium]
MEPRKKLGLFLGPLVFFIIYFSSILKHNPRAHTLLAVFFLTVIWWVTEAIPIPVTALIVPILITGLGIASAKEAFAPFANPIIILFLGSFILAKAMRVHQLDERFAYSILSIKSISKSRFQILLAFGIVTASLSMWLSNTATTAMMYPIGLGLLSSYRSKLNEKTFTSMGIIMMLMAAYASSVGGIGTPIGSPPNLIAIGMLEKLANYKITFFQWMVINFTILIPMFFALFFLLKFRLPKGKIEGFSFKRIESKLTRPQKNVLIAFSVTVFLWVFPGIVALISGKEATLYLWLSNHIPEATAALIGASLLFLLPVEFRKGKFTLTLNQALDIDWGTLLLFGGGLSLGFQMFETGLAEIIGHGFISSFSSRSLSLITLLSIILGVYLTEVTSNTATANMIIPIIIAVSKAANINPIPPVLGSAIGASFAFMLPVATPPNAIIYGSGLVPLTKMMKYGFWLNILGVIIIWIGIIIIAPTIGIY